MTQQNASPQTTPHDALAILQRLLQEKTAIGSEFVVEQQLAQGLRLPKEFEEIYIFGHTPPLEDQIAAARADLARLERWKEGETAAVRWNTKIKEIKALLREIEAERIT